MINKECSLILSDLYEYDFAACAYNVLKNIGWDLSGVNKRNKIQRNIQIGLIQRDNPDIAQYLQYTIDNLIDLYLRENHIKDHEIILRQKDGVVLTKPLKFTNFTMKLEFRGIISKLIFSTDRRKWLKIHQSGDVVVKGLGKELYDASFYQLFRELNYANRSMLIQGVENIRRRILSSESISWFMLKDDDCFLVPILDAGLIKVRKSTIKSVDCNDVDKDYLWNTYVWPFAQAILVFCTSR
jgi:hypothetical protein